MKIIKKIINKFKLASKFSKLGTNFKGKIILFFYTFWLPIKKKFGAVDKIKKEIKIKKFNKIFTLYLTDSSDLAVLNEIFVNDEYGISIKGEPEVIFDLGSNIGLSAIYFKLKYPQAKIYAFEPDPNTYKKLIKNTKQFKDIFCYNIAVSDKNGKTEFYSCSGQSMSSSLVNRDNIESCSKIYVETRDLDTLINEFKIKEIDLLKFDIEGAEFNVFNNFQNLNIIKNMIGELHLDLMNQGKEDFFRIFKDFKVNIKNSSKSGLRYILEIKH